MSEKEETVEIEKYKEQKRRTKKKIIITQKKGHVFFAKCLREKFFDVCNESYLFFLLTTRIKNKNMK